MNIDDALALGTTLLEEHGVTDHTVQMTKRLTTLGAAHYWHEQTIRLSYSMVMLNDEATVRLVILHEIAHALVERDVVSHNHRLIFADGHSEDAHGPTFKRVVESISIRDDQWTCKRYYAWTMSCPTCGWSGDWGRRGTYICRTCDQPVMWTKNPPVEVVAESL